MRILPILAILLLVTACAPTPLPTITAEEPLPAAPIETAPEPVEEAPVAEPDEPDFVEVDEEGVEFDGPITRVVCDQEAREMAFTFTNPTQFTLHLDKDIPFPSPKGQAIVTFSMNGVDMNSGTERRFNDEVLFGELPFSSHCGTSTVEPGASATCTLKPVPLKTQAGVDAATNDLAMKTQGVYKVVTFLC